MNNKKENKVLNKIKWIATRGIFIVAYIVLLNVLQASQVFAADDPLTVINNLSNFIFGLIRAVGMIILGFGIVQVGMSLKSHDPSQRANQQDPRACKSLTTKGNCILSNEGIETTEATSSKHLP